jgi:phosphohistidine phosphatase
VIPIYLMRHAAAEAAVSEADDPGRPLTRDGIEDVHLVVRGLCALRAGVDVVLTSPLLRARQTAEILAAGLTPQPAIESVGSLSPDGSYGAFLHDLSQQPRHAVLLCVGHEKHLGRIAGHLVGTDRRLHFARGAVCRIDLELSGPGHLIWFAPPWVFSRLGRYPV